MSPKNQVISLKEFCLKTITNKLIYSLSDDEGTNYEVVANYISPTTFEVLQDLLKIILNSVNLDAKIRFNCLQLLLREDVRKLDTGMFPQFYYQKILNVISLQGSGLQHLNLKGVWARDFPYLLSQLVRSLRGLKTLLIPHMADDAVIEAIMTLEELVVLDISGEACFTGVKTIRKSVLGDDLPNPRSLRVKLLEDYEEYLDRNLSRAVIASCQFFSYDLSRLDLAYPADSCCTEYMQNLIDPGPYCASIDIPENDPVYSETNANCISVVNAKTNLDYGCSITIQAQQISDTTPFADLSPIYGYDADSNDKVRSYVDGKLKVEYRNGYPYLTINPDKYSCYIPSGFDDQCLLSGDPGVNQNLDIRAFLTLWTREHNRLCVKLKYYNPCWDDEKLYQTARRINIAIHQWMFYFELLPYILGKDVVEHTGVAPYP